MILTTRAGLIAASSLILCALGALFWVLSYSDRSISVGLSPQGDSSFDEAPERSDAALWKSGRTPTAGVALEENNIDSVEPEALLAAVLGGLPLEVSVFDEYDLPLLGAHVWLESDGDHPRTRGTTDMSGACQLIRPHGETDYIVRAEAPERLPEFRTVKAWSREARFVLATYTEIHGVVTSESDGSPIRAAKVSTLCYGGLPEDAANPAVLTDGNGEFGPLRVPNRRRFMLTASAPGFVLAGQTTLADVSLPPSRIAIVLRPARRLEFFVHDGMTGRPLAGVELSGRGWNSEHASTDEDGLATLLQTVAVSGSDHSVSIEIEAEGYCPVAARLTLENTPVDGPLSTPLFPACRVEGRTLDQAGEPVGRVALQGGYDFPGRKSAKGHGTHRSIDTSVVPDRTLVPAWPSYLRWDPRSHFPTATSSESGHFHFDGLAPSLLAFDVTPTQEGGEGVTASVVGLVKPGLTLSLDVRVDELQTR